MGTKRDREMDRYYEGATEPAPCYHIWSEADGGNCLFRLRRCFKAKSTADTTARRGAYGEQGAQYIDKGRKQMVMRCLDGCPCGPGKKEHQNKG